VVSAVVFFGADRPAEYVWFALAGAGITAAFGYLLGTSGRGSSHAQFALSGIAVAATLQALTFGFTTLNPAAYNEIRFWLVGTAAGRDMAVVATVAPMIFIGTVLALLLGRTLNTLALGEDTSRSLGARPGLTQALGTLAVLLLCGAATAGIGPVAFLGLAVPHMVRWLTGPDHRWVLTQTLAWAPALLLIADVLGRVIAYPGEIPVAIVMAFLGAPIFILLLRRRRVVTQ
jgi:iron complex transport system permease protein